MAVLSSFFQMFIVLGMYNFAFTSKESLRQVVLTYQTKIIMDYVILMQLVLFWYMHSIELNVLLYKLEPFIDDMVECIR